MRNGNVLCGKSYETFDFSALYTTIPHKDGSLIKKNENLKF